MRRKFLSFDPHSSMTRRLVGLYKVKQTIKGYYEEFCRMATSVGLRKESEENVMKFEDSQIFHQE